LVVKELLLCSLLLSLGTSLPAAENGALHDPLRPLDYRPSVTSSAAKPVALKASEWRLGAVLVSTERQVAVINGQSLQVGDLFDGYELVEIESSQVVLQKKQKTVVLRRSGTGLKKAFSSRDVTTGSQP
jgi:hypothetical protein